MGSAAMVFARSSEPSATDADRLSELYARHAPDAFRLAYLVTGERALAEDLMQEAFIRVAGRLGHLRKPDAFGAYLRRTVLNLAKMQFRRRRVERAHMEREAVTVEAADPTIEFDAHEDLWHELQRLPYRQRAAIVLRYYEGLSDYESAEVLRCRPGTVRSLLSRGLGALRTSIGVF